MDLNDIKINKNTKRIERYKTIYNDTSKIQKNFEILAEKVQYAQRQMTAWDFLKITQIVNSTEEFPVKVKNLGLNTAAIVNCRYSENMVTYAPGDIIYRNADYTLTHIPAERGGIFYPQKIKLQGNSYEITYAFIASNPVDGTSTATHTGNEWNVTNPKTKIQFTGLTASEDGTTYGVVINGSPWAFAAQMIDNSSLVNPVFKSYNSNKEEVIWDLTWSISGNNIQVATPPNIVNFIVVK